ncbi:MAG: DNA alkylation repair protein [Candidatus Eremiobacterota bacterium]
MVRLDLLEEAYRAHADPHRAAGMSAYMRYQFEYFGLPTPLRRQVGKPFLVILEAPQLAQAVRDLWLLPQREFLYFAVELCGKSRKRWTPDLLELFHFMVVTRSWWDTVDAVAHLVGDLLLRFPGLVPEMDRWIESDDFWVQRIALLHQLGYKGKTDADRLFRYCARVAESREFFLRKAIGWALRQYACTDPEAVRRFVADQGHRLSGLSRREALRHIG